MRNFIGYLFILSFVPIIWLTSEKIWQEFAILQEQAEQIDSAIHLPEMNIQLPVTLVDRNGNIFSEEYVEWRQPTKLENIPMIARQVYILSEDKGFYDHIGFDLSAITRAVIANSSEQSIQQGGSTITQQVVRMRYLSQERTYERKLMELFYAYELEQAYSKEDILEMYLNESYFGNHVYGIGGAATYYFQRPLAELTSAEIIFLCAIPNNPSLYNPLTNFDATKERQERLLDALVTGGFLSLAESDTYKQEQISLHIKDKVQQYPSYTTYVLQELKWLIAENEGYKERISNAANEVETKVIQAELDARIDKLLQTGLTIYTALDPQKQLADEARIDALLTKPELQASATVIDNDTREIVSMYAGKDYNKFDYHRAFQGTRQPGSAFKPLIVYAPLFETTTYTPDSIVSGGSYCIGNFCPQNYGGAVYGDVSIRQAFRHSYNTSALRLFNTVGIDTAFSYIDRFHFQSLIEEDKTYAASLGGLSYGVTTLEMADAYTSFIDGTYTQAHGIRKITDVNGEQLFAWENSNDPIWSSKTVNYVRSLLQDVVSNGTGQGIYSHTSYVGAKTGTTNEFKDFWITGLDQTYTASVWIGYDKPRSMQAIENNKIHHRIFNAVLQ